MHRNICFLQILELADSDRIDRLPSTDYDINNFGLRFGVYWCLIKKKFLFISQICVFPVSSAVLTVEPTPRGPLKRSKKESEKKASGAAVNGTKDAENGTEDDGGMFQLTELTQIQQAPLFKPM